MIHLRRAIFSISCAFCLLSITCLQAAGIWTEPVSISSTASDRPSIGIDAGGNAIAVWREFDGNYTSIKSSVLPKNGTWSTPETIFSIPGYAITVNPRIAVSALGEAIVVWQTAIDLGTTVKAARLPFKGEWSAPVDISEPARIVSFQNPQIAIDLAGNATAIWSRNYNGKEIIETATLPFEGSWSLPRVLSSLESNAQFPQLSVNLKGDAIAIWKTSQTVQTAERVDNKWNAPIAIASGISMPTYPKVKLDNQGNAAAIWIKSESGNSSIQASTKFMGNWTAPLNLSKANQRVLSTGFDLSMDPKGTVIAVWDVAASITYASIFSACFIAGEDWSQPVIISGDKDMAYNAQVETGYNGDTLAVWENDFCIQAAAWHAVDGWSSPVTISKLEERAQLPTIAIDPSGYAVVVWRDLDAACIKAATWVPNPSNN